MNVEDIYRPPQVDMEAPAPLALGKPATSAPFFQTSPLKVALLSIATFGLYRLAWFYRNWERREKLGDDVSPIGRTIFAIFFVYSLFRTVNEEIDRAGDLETARREPSESPGMLSQRVAHLQAVLLALLFIGLSLVGSLAGRAADATALGCLCTLLSCVPMVIVQKKINELNAALGYDPNEGTAFTGSTIAALVIGGLLWILIVIGSLGAGR